MGRIIKGGSQYLGYFAIFIWGMANCVSAQSVWKDTTSVDGHAIRMKRNLKTGIPDRAIGLVVNLNRYGPVSESNIRALGRQFLEEYAQLFKINPGSLRFKGVEKWRNRLHIEYEQHQGGVPVYNADIKFTVFENGNVPIVAQNYYPDININTEPSVSPEDALEIASTNYMALGKMDSIVTISGPDLFVLPIKGNEGYSYSLAYKIQVVAEGVPSQTYFINALNGEIITQYSNIRGHTKVYGYITQEYWPKYYDTDDPVATGFIRVNLTYLSGGFAATKVPSSNGYYGFMYDYMGRDLAQGPYFVTYHLQDAHVKSESRTRVRVKNAQGDMVLVTNSSGRLDAYPHAYFSDHVSVNNTPLGSAPNVYYHLDRIRKYFRGSPFNYYGMNFTITADLSSTTSYKAENDHGKKIKFGKEAGYNWAGLSDVIYHEYTHSLTWKLYGDQTPAEYAAPEPSFEAQALDEGISDYFSSALNEDPVQGDHTSTSTTPRSLVNQLNYSDLGQYEEHWAGTILGGACWDLREMLNDPGDYVDMIAFEALQEKPITYEEFAEYIAVADDNDGNLNNGCPHYDDIEEAFEINHGIPVYDPPLYVYITGPCLLEVDQYGTWTANASGGTGSYSYKWYAQSVVEAPQWWGPVDYDSSLTMRMHDAYKYLNLRVDVTSGLEQESDYHFVDCIDCSGEGGDKRITDWQEPIPESYALTQNHPNPFNPATTIRYDLPEASNVRLVIYDIAGREVRSWNLQEPAGYRQVMWDGKYQNGQLAPAGIYIYRLTAASIESNERFMASRKMVLMK